MTKYLKSKTTPTDYWIFWPWHPSALKREEKCLQIGKRERKRNTTTEWLRTSFEVKFMHFRPLPATDLLREKEKCFLKKKVPQWVDLIGSPVSNITARTGHLRQFFHTLKQSLQVRIVLYKLMRSQRCCFCALVRGRDWIPYGINEETREHRGQINCPRSSSEWRPKRSSSLCFLTARLWVFAYKHQSICCA